MYLSTYRDTLTDLLASFIMTGILVAQEAEQSPSGSVLLNVASSKHWGWCVILAPVCFGIASFLTFYLLKVET